MMKNAIVRDGIVFMILIFVAAQFFHICPLLLPYRVGTSGHRRLLSFSVGFVESVNLPE